MYASAANIRDGCHDALADIVLYIEMPLLHVGPSGRVRQRNELQRRGTVVCKQTWRQRRVGDGNRLSGTYARDGSALALVLQGLGIGFVSIGMLEENTVASSDGPFPIAKRIEGKPQPWRWIPPMVF